MDDAVKGYIKRIYFDRDYDFFMERCKTIPYYLQGLVDTLRPMCKNITIENLKNNKAPSILL